MLLEVVNGAAPTLTDAAKVVDLALELESGAATTYVANVANHQQERPVGDGQHHGCQQHHRDHADAWNGVLTGAGKTPITGVDLTVKKSVDKTFGQVTDVAGLATLALDLENVASATYLAAIDGVK